MTSNQGAYLGLAMAPENIVARKIQSNWQKRTNLQKCNKKSQS